MSKQVALSLVVLLLSILALASSRMTPSPEGTTAPLETPLSARAQNDDGVASQAPELEARVRALEAEVRLLRSGGAAPGGVPAEVPLVGARRASQALARADEADDGAVSVEAPEVAETELRAHLATVLDEELQKRDEQRWEARRARWAQRQDERLQELAQRLSLSDDQQQKLSAMLAAEREEIGAVMQRASAEMGWREARREVRDIRRRTDENAKAILDDEQAQAYDGMRSEDFFAGRRGQDGRGPDARED